MVIENLVFQGGGVKGIAYAGAVEMLAKYQILPHVKRVAGTSAGAITALLLALRYNADEFHEITMNMNYKALEDHFNPLRILTHYGLYKGDALLHWLKNIVRGSGLQENATFVDLEDFGGLDLRVFACDLNDKVIEEFSVHNTPKVKIAEAVRASMSIPLYFEAWQFPDHYPDDHIYVDGGMVFNFPITVFDSEDSVNNATLGFHMENLNFPHDSVNLKHDELILYIRTIFEMLLNSQDLEFLKDETAMARTVRIDDFGIASTDFNVSNERKFELYESGKVYTEAYLLERLGMPRRH